MSGEYGRPVKYLASNTASTHHQNPCIGDFLVALHPVDSTQNTVAICHFNRGDDYEM